MAIAQLSDVAVLLGRELDEYEEPMVVRRLEDIEARIVFRAAKHNKTLADLDPAIVKIVEAEAVLRIVRNPEGYLEESDGNYSYVLGRDSAGSLSVITGDEWEFLGLVSRRVFTFRGYRLEDML